MELAQHLHANYPARKAKGDLMNNSRRAILITGLTTLAFAATGCPGVASVSNPPSVVSNPPPVDTGDTADTAVDDSQDDQDDGKDEEQDD
jgi:hypothetical protein